MRDELTRGLMASKRRVWLAFIANVWCIYFGISSGNAQPRPIPTRVAYSALSAGIGVLWLTHEQGIFRKYGLDSNLIYMRSGTTAAQALLAGEIQYGHLSPAPMLAAWAQGADIVRRVL
jgi:ABC-type nitrate/sulfonate/bicarbonate transport system substrate-binding protein